MQHIDLLRSLALSSALILALGGISTADDEDTSDAVEPPSVEAAPPSEAPEAAADETTPPAEKSDTEASEAQEE